jgi:hypothetical protein
MSPNSNQLNGNPQIIRLGRSGDYQTWQLRVKQPRSANVWNNCSGDEFPPPKPEIGSKDRATIKDWRDYTGRKESAIAHICFALSEELCKVYEDNGQADHPNILWDAIKMDKESWIKRNAMPLRAGLY